MGQIIQSHSMHFFELAGPDLLLGFDLTRPCATWPACTWPIRSSRQGNSPAEIRPGDHRGAGQPPRASQLCRPGRREQDADGGRSRRDPGQVEQMIGYVQDGLAIIKSWMAAHAEELGKFGVSRPATSAWWTRTTRSTLRRPVAAGGQARADSNGSTGATTWTISPNTSSRGPT